MSKLPKATTPLEAAYEYCNEHGLLEDAIGRSVMLNYDHGVCDDFIASELNSRAKRHAQRVRRGQIAPFKRPRLPSRDLILDVDEHGQAQAGMDANVLRSHLLIGGNTGAGKTTLIFNICVALIGQAKLWMTDSYKADLRHLWPYFQQKNESLIILPHEDLRLNILQPDGCDPRKHLNISTDLLVRVLGLADRAGTILRNTCDDLYEQYGVYQGGEFSPHLIDVFESIKGQTDLNAASKSAILDRLSTLLTALTPQAAALHKAWSPVDLAKDNIVYEMRGAHEYVRSVQNGHCVNAIAQYAIDKGKPNQGLKLFFLLDDAQRILQEKESLSGEVSPLEEFLQVTRSGGQGFGFNIQSPANIPSGIRANTATKFMGRLGTHEDWSRMGADMNLNAEQLAFAKLNLKPGLFIGLLSETWRHPFLMRVPNLDLAPTVDEALVQASQTPLQSLPIKFDTRYANWSPRPRNLVPLKYSDSDNSEDQVTPSTTPQTPAIQVPETTAPTPPQIESTSSATSETACETSGGGGWPGLKEGQIRFLEAVVQHPGLPSSRYVKLARISPRDAVATRKLLVQLQVIREHQLATGKRGRNATVLEPLADAQKLIDYQRSRSKV